MGLTDQQKLYGLNNYYFLMRDCKVVGLLTEDTVHQVSELPSEYRIMSADLDGLNEQGITILRSLGAI